MSKARRPPSGLEASVRARLSDLAKARKEDFQFVLTRYALERLLYRLSRSKHRDRFVLKGAMLFQLWTGQSHRPTRDLDLLGRGDLTADTARTIFSDLCGEAVPDDGLRFDAATIQVEEVREDQEYRGMRVKFQATLAAARLPILIDIGTGDVVTPKPDVAEYPTLLDFPAPRLLTYPRETVVAEKFQAIVMLGLANTRIKDFYDLWVLAKEFAFDGPMLSRAIVATFERRQTELPTETPVALTQAFWQDGGKWRAFLSRNSLQKAGHGVEEMMGLLRRFLLPPCAAAARGSPSTRFELRWSPGGDWKTQV